MNQQQISFYVTMKNGRPDKSFLPPNTPKQVFIYYKTVNKINGVLLG